MREFARKPQPEGPSESDPARPVADLALAPRPIRPPAIVRFTSPEPLPEDFATQRALSDVGRQRAGPLGTREMPPTGPLSPALEQDGYDLGPYLETMPRKLLGFLPSTGLGMFDVELAPPKLILSMRIHFTF